jgi:hypothetical protein
MLHLALTTPLAFILSAHVMVIGIITAVEMPPAMHGLTLSKPFSRHNAKSMVNMMDRNTKDSTSGKSGAIYEVSSYSNASNTCPIHPNAQVDAYSSAMVVHQPNLEVVEISDKCCPVNVACAGGQRLCLSVTTGAHVRFDPVIVIACINGDLIDQGSTNHTVCQHKAYDYCIYDRGKISCLVSQRVMSIVTNLMWDLTPQLVHTFPTEWNSSMMTRSTMMLGLVNNEKHWIDALHNKVISLLKDTLWGGYTLYLPVAKKTLSSAQASQNMVEWEMSQFA